LLNTAFTQRVLRL